MTRRFSLSGTCGSTISSSSQISARSLRSPITIALAACRVAVLSGLLNGQPDQERVFSE